MTLHLWMGVSMARGGRGGIRGGGMCGVCARARVCRGGGGGGGGGGCGGGGEADKVWDVSYPLT